jgi:hypothetical protein
MGNHTAHYDYRLDYDWIFWVVNFKIGNYFVIFYYTENAQVIYMYDCSNFVHSCQYACQNDKNLKWGYGS